jgi:hypothetical protein
MAFASGQAFIALPARTTKRYKISTMTGPRSHGGGLQAMMAGISPESDTSSPPTIKLWIRHFTGVPFETTETRQVVSGLPLSGEVIIHHDSVQGGCKLKTVPIYCLANIFISMKKLLTKCNLYDKNNVGGVY